MPQPISIAALRTAAKVARDHNFAPVISGDDLLAFIRVVDAASAYINSPTHRIGERRDDLAEALKPFGE